MNFKPLFPLILCLFGSPLFGEEASVLWVPLKGTVELGLSPYVQRAVRYAEEKQMQALVLEVDTFGGRVDAAVTIRDALLDAKVPTVAFINKRAISAGALISLATRKIYFTPGSTMGAATPISMGAEGAEAVEDKIVSYFRAEMGATAEKNKKDRRIAEAMVKAPENIKGLIAKGEVLTLTDKTAAQTKISDGTVETKENLLKILNVTPEKVEDFKINWAETFVRWTTNPTVSGLLMSGGILGLVMEFKAPGFGLPGIFGIACFAIFFFGKFLVHLAGWEEVILLLFGLICLAIEFIFLPGKLIPAAVGLTLIFISLFLAGISPKIPFHFDVAEVRQQVNSIAIAIVCTFFGLFGIYFYLARHPRYSPLVLTDTLQSAGAGTPDRLIPINHGIGSFAKAETDLRPSGKALMSGEMLDVVTRGEFIPKGEEVEIVEIGNGRIVVQLRKRT